MDKNEILLALAKSILEVEGKLAKKEDKEGLAKAATFGALTTHPAFKAAKRDGKSDQEAMQAAKDALTVRDTNEESNKAPNR